MIAIALAITFFASQAANASLNHG